VIGPLQCGCQTFSQGVAGGRAHEF